MNSANAFFKAIKIDVNDKLSLRRFSQSIGIPLERLNYYNSSNTLPTGSDLQKICNAISITHIELKLKMGLLDTEIISAIQQNLDEIYHIIKKNCGYGKKIKPIPSLIYKSNLGKLYQGDCLDLMPHIENESIDLIFADPPFNLNKLYPSKINDNLKAEQYIKWCESWIDECIRLLKIGGSFFLWNLPKWNIHLSGYLNKRLTFRHWISVDIKYSLPIKNRLYPSHYSLLYYCKGEKPSIFNPDRLPMPICPHCLGDLKDYGGYKNKMNPKGVNITDVWLDIPPVRHAKYKKRNGANELSIKLLDRIIELASNEDDTVFDPFGGSGTTYAVAELKNRKWIGIEIGPIDAIVNRFQNLKNDSEYLDRLRQKINCLFTKKDLDKRVEFGLWTPDSVRKKKLA